VLRVGLGTWTVSYWGWIGSDRIGLELPGFGGYCIGLTHGKGLGPIVGLSGEPSVGAESCGLCSDEWNLYRS
jgi:hypothetical protein